MPSSNATSPGSPPQIPPSERLLQLTGGYGVSAAIYAVTRLGIPDLLAGGPRTASELASRSGCKEDPLFRVLKILASLDVIRETAPREFVLTPVSELLRSDAPGGLRNLVLWVADPLHFQMWSELTESVKTGRTAVDILSGLPAFEYMGGKPEVFKSFNAAMTTVSARLVPAVLDAYDFSGIETLMDVAGGHGYSICEILQRYPMMKGILFDLPSVVEHPECRVCALHLGDRCGHATGDFFERIPGGADAYYLQHIIHDWDDDRARRILDNCRRALGDAGNGRLVVVDNVLPEDSRPHPGRMMDLQMMLFPGGRERTEPELRRLFEKGGFRITKIVTTRLAESVIEARPI